MTTLTDLAAPARPAAGTRHPGAAPDRQQQRSHGRGFWVAGYVFAVTMAFSTVPAPLYVLYQARDHFGALLVTVIFAAYAAGVMASLFLAGHISDWLGRRRMIATAVGVNMASGIVFLAWPAVPGLFTSLAPGFIAGTLGDRSHALAGLATFAVFGAAALAQIALSRAATSRQLRIGLATLTLGLALVTIAVWLPSLTLFLAGGAVAGAGAGAAFKGSISTVIAVALPTRRGETLAWLFLAAYFGIAVPVLGLGLATQFVSTQIAVLGFAAVLAAVAAVATSRLAAGPGHSGPQPGAAESSPHRQAPAIATAANSS